MFSGRGDTDSGDVADVDGEREDGRPATRVTAHSTYHWKLVNVGDPNGSLPIIFNLKIIIRISFQSSLAAAPLFDHPNAEISIKISVKKQSISQELDSHLCSRRPRFCLIYR